MIKAPLHHLPSAPSPIRWCRTILIHGLALVLTFPWCGGQDAPAAGGDPLTDFISKYELAKKESLAPIEQLRGGYARRLQTELESAKAEGILDQVQAILAEVEWVAGRGKMPDLDKSSGILKLREVYLKSLQDREQQRVERLEGIAERSTDVLAEIEKQFTREGKVDRAVAARAFAGQLKDEVATIKAALDSPGIPPLKAGESILWKLESPSDFKAVQGCEFTEAAGNWILTCPPEMRGHLESRISFVPPFRISALVTPESGDLRFYFGPETSMEFVLFNWTRSPTTLRLVDPTGVLRIESVSDQGFLTFGQSYLIEIVVRERKIEVFVDGNLRGARQVNLDGYREPVGIGPFGTETLPAKLILEHFAVIQLEE